MEELKPCPFCGGEAAIQEYDDDSGGVYCVVCRFQPLVHASYNRSEDKQKAIDWWNLRPHQWIPVAERLPEPGTEGLVYSPSCDKIFKAIARYGVWVFAYDHQPILVKISHWMPLPSPPKPDREVSE